MKRLWSNYSLGIVYLVSWILTWGLHAFFTWQVDQFPHGEAAWWLNWLETSFENLASEYHQVGIFILFARWFIFKDSPQSKDGDARMEGKIDAILDRLRRARIGGVE